MSALSLAAVLALASACQGAVAAETIAGIAQHESSFQPWAIHDNATGRTYTPDTKPDAARIAAELIEAGHDPDIGLLQINAKNFGWLGLTVENALDPCHSVAAGAAVLTAFSRYNSGSPTAGIANGYAQAVMASVAQVKGQAVTAQGKADTSPISLAPPSLPAMQAEAELEDRPAGSGEIIFGVK
jgi:type IV secretion system protein VirB1